MLTSLCSNTLACLRFLLWFEKPQGCHNVLSCLLFVAPALLLTAELAEQCYEAARGVEPTLVPVWEAMAATAATGSAAGTVAAAAAAEHAVGLGGGPESWLEHSVGQCWAWCGGAMLSVVSSMGVHACLCLACTQVAPLLLPTAG